MGLFSSFRFKSHKDTFISNTVLKVINDFFGFNTGSVTMRKLIDAYATNPIVFSIINKITGVCDGTEKQLLSGDTEVDSGDVFDVLNNLNEEELYSNLLTTGNTFLKFTRGIGAGAEFEVWNSKDVEIILNGSDTEVIGYRYTPGNLNITAPAEEVLHIKFANIVKTDSNRIHFGYSPLEAGMKIVIASTEIFGAEAAIFKNRGVIGMISSGNDFPMKSDDQKHIQEAFQDKVAGSDKFNKVLVTSANAKYIQLGMSPQDLQLIDNQISKLRFLCALYGIDSKLLGDGENSTYNNVREAQRNAYMDTYLPLMKRVNKALIKYLNEQFNTDFTYEVNLSKVEAIKEQQTLEQLILEKISEEEMTLEQLTEIQSRIKAPANGAQT
jgi:HK97 family phage portal protein